MQTIAEIKAAVTAHWSRRAAKFDTGPTHLALVEGAWWDMMPKDEYAAVHDGLPLFRDAGFDEPRINLPTDAACWVDAPKHERYLIVAPRP